MMTYEELRALTETHEWDMGWRDSNKPHPGFGGSQNIYGGYTSQCKCCGIYIEDFDKNPAPCYNEMISIQDSDAL